jgi:dolichyl-phosphate-mannose-protein mannosyltransferase
MMPGLGRATTDAPSEAASRNALLAVFGVGLLLACVIRVVLLPTEGLRGDIDQFVLWVHGLATKPFGNAFDQNLTFPPVMVYLWGLLGLVDSAFKTVTDAADPAIRAIMKLPASLADLVIGCLVAWELRARPRWAVAAGVGILLHPAVIDVSAWWGQYESIYAMFGLIAFLLAVRGHSLPAAAVLAVALMTKPQALPFLVPFGAWFLARDGWLGAAKAAIVGAVVIAVLWAPFLAAGGPAGYARNLGEYQGEIFAILSLRAWNVWWLVQELLAGGSFVSDQGAIFGPLTLRHVGYLLAGILEVVVFFAVLRSATPRTLAIGLAAAVLVAFMFLTTMHERYAYGALVFLALLIPERRFLVTWIVFGIAFTLNLFAAVPPSPEIGALLPVQGLLGIAGSIAMLAVTIAVLQALLRAPSASLRDPSPASVDARQVAAHGP